MFIFFLAISVNSAEFSLNLGGKGNWTYNIDFPNCVIPPDEWFQSKCDLNIAPIFKSILFNFDKDMI